MIPTFKTYVTEDTPTIDPLEVTLLSVLASVVHPIPGGVMSGNERDAYVKQLMRRLKSTRAHRIADCLLDPKHPHQYPQDIQDAAAGLRKWVADGPKHLRR